MSKRISQRKFAELYERETGFDMMDRDPLHSAKEHIAYNIQWFREWAEETARRLEDAARGIR